MIFLFPATSISTAPTRRLRIAPAWKAGKTLPFTGDLQTEAKWEDHVLLVTSTQDGVRTAVERYRLNGDGEMALTVDRPGHQSETLMFERQ